MRSSMGGLAFLLVVLGFLPLQAQDRGLPLAPVPPAGEGAAPIFEGWFPNSDGTYMLSFGYLNFNSSEVLEIPQGPDNFIEPAEFDGVQPTSFTPLRERGAFTIILPSDWDRSRDVVWTLRHRGETLSVPGRVGVPAYELAWEMAMKSSPPSLRLDPSGPEGRGPTGVKASAVRTTWVGEPLPLTLWVADVSERVDQSVVPIGVAWFKHQGPLGAEVRFGEPEWSEGEGEGEVTTTATFGTPGTYVLRVRADNWSASDSSSGDQCCWTNGYVTVSVTP